MTNLRTLYNFNGGVHPPQHKDVSAGRPIVKAPIPSRLTIPLHQHIGNVAKPIVQVGEKVLKGQMIAQAEGYVSASVHASTSGTVRAIEMLSVPHPSGLPDLCIVLESDGQDTWTERFPLNYREMDLSDLRNRLRDAGVVGLGGAVFPSFIKLNPGPQQKIQTLIINGAECEPWITCDDMLMRERADEIVKGIEIMRYLMRPEEILIGIEDNKPEAITAMQAACSNLHFQIDVIPVPTIYPGGGAKQLIKVLTNKEPPSGGRSTDIGVQCFNVATAYSIHRAINHGEPVISRIVTVTGNVTLPQNFEILIGTPVNELVALTGTPKANTNRYIMGGPMMGFDLPSDQVPAIKATNCIIAASPKLFPQPPTPMQCIRCTRCAQACPVDLQPQELYWFARSKNLGKAQEYFLFDCIECGCCSYVCPSNIPLVQYYRFAKSEIWAREKEKQASDLARERHEFRQLRIDREKQERAEKLAKKAAAAKAAPAPSVEGAASPSGVDSEAAAKKAVIQAAIARSKAKKAGIAPKNVDNLPPDKLKEIQSIEARREKIRELAQKEIE